MSPGSFSHIFCIFPPLFRIFWATPDQTLLPQWLAYPEPEGTRPSDPFPFLLPESCPSHPPPAFQPVYCWLLLDAYFP